MTRLDYLTKELLTEMKDAGCYAIELGVESANPGSLKRMKKNISIDRLMEVLVWTKEVGIFVSLFFMFGFPWESAEEARNTNRFMQKISGMVDRFNPGGVLIPFPGTEIYEEYKDSEGFENWWLTGWQPKDFSPLHKLQPWYFFNYSDEIKKVIKEGLDFIERHNSKRPLGHILKKVGISQI